MRIGRTLPPAAAPVLGSDLWHGLRGLISPARTIRQRQDELRQHFGVRHVSLVSSGTAALTLTLRALKSLSPRREVIIPAYTCFSVPAAVVAAGLRPVLCDICAETFDYDATRLEPLLTSNPLAVVAQHLFGVPADTDRLRALCRPRGVFLVEDAAQAMGVSSTTGVLGTLGDAGIFSLGRGKNITCGAGGIIVTNSDPIGRAVADECRRLPAPSMARTARSFAQLALMTLFIRPQLYWIPAALPFLGLGQTVFPKTVTLERMSGMQAGFLHHWRTRLGCANQTRATVVGDFSRRLALKVAPSHPYLRLPVLTDTPLERSRLYSLSEQQGLGLSLAYPSAVNAIPEICQMFEGQHFPAAERVAERLLTVPTHHWLSESDKSAITRIFAR